MYIYYICIYIYIYIYIYTYISHSMEKITIFSVKYFSLQLFSVTYFYTKIEISIYDIYYLLQ